MAKIVFMLTKTPYGKSETPEALNLALESLKNGDTVSIYLLSDAVFCAKQGLQGEVGKRMKEAVDLGAEVRASRAELTSRGISERGVISGVDLPENLIGLLLEDVMERAESVLSF